jgi:hypothetical protein
MLFLWFIPGFPIVMIIGSKLFYGHELIVFFVYSAVAFYFNIRFMILSSVCPWCGQSFVKKNDGYAVGDLGLFRKKCANCGNPNE